MVRCTCVHQILTLCEFNLSYPTHNELRWWQVVDLRHFYMLLVKILSNLMEVIEER